MGIYDFGFYKIDFYGYGYVNHLRKVILEGLFMNALSQE